MAPVSAALELDDDELALSVETQEVDAPAGTFEVTELLGNHVEVVIDEVDVIPQGSLEVRALLDVLGGKAGARQFDQCVLRKKESVLDLCHVVERHYFSSHRMSIPPASVMLAMPACANYEIDDANAPVV